LAPSFAEGFGLPVAEALAARAPVIASDIAPFREQGGENVTYLDPRSDEEWRRAIVEHCHIIPARRSAPPAQGESDASRLRAFDDFLRSLAL
jgi:glycosyltransferase involved in cell wall biosynthesis